jgi:hypothetical protein
MNNKFIEVPTTSKGTVLVSVAQNGVFHSLFTFYSGQ